MASLRELDAHFPALVIDAASAVIQVGCVLPGGRQEWQTSTAEAGIGVFEAVEKLSLKPSAAAAFVFCEGPGSILGIRTVAMAIRTWCVLQPRPVFAYSSLALVAHALADSNTTVIADARRNTWHAYRLGTRLKRLESTALSGALVMPEGFRNWTPLPDTVKATPYRVESLLSAAADADLFRPTDAPDAFLHEEPSYVAWTPQIHQVKR